MSIIKIWLGDLSAYNAGILKGEWLSLPMDPEALQAKVELYTCNGQSDYFIADSETPEGIKIGEYSNPTQLNELAESLAELSERDLDRVIYLIDDIGYSIADALDNYENVDYYQGLSLKQLAEHFVDEGLFGQIADSIKNYIDYDAIARDLRHDYTETSKGCFRYD